MRPIDGDALIEYCNNQKDKTIDANDIARFPTAVGWISVKDRMPDENVAVNIVWVNTDPESYYKDIKDKPFVATGVYFRGEWYWWSSVVQDYLAEYGVGFTDRMDESIIVTHWMPFPEPPKEVAQ